MMSGGTKVWSVVVAMTVEAVTSEAAVGFVRAELAAKLRSEYQPWQGEAPDLLPHWEIADVQRRTKPGECDGPFE